MNLSETTIKAIAELYTIEELKLNLNNAVQEMLQNPEKIISASTGSGASYTKTVTMSAVDMVELFSMAIEYKQNGFIGSSGNNIMRVVSWI